MFRPVLFPAREGSGGLPAEGELLGGELLPHGFIDFQHFFHGQFGVVQVAGNLSVEVASGFEPLIASHEAARLPGNIHVKTNQRYARQQRIPGYQIVATAIFVHRSWTRSCELR